MTEQLGEPAESNIPLIPARYEEERVPEDFMRSMRQAGSELAGQSFNDMQSARDAGIAFCREWQGRSESCDTLRTVTMRAEGDMMYVANTQYEEDPQGNITIRHSNDPMLVPLASMSIRQFQFRRLYQQIGGYRMSDECHVTPFVIGNDMTASRQAFDMRPGFPLTSILYQTSVMIPCISDVDVQSVHLRHERRRASAIGNLAAYARHYPDIMNDLAQIDHEMFEAKGRDSEMKRVSALRELGRVGVEFSSLGFKHEDALNSAIETTLGEDRHLTVNGNIYTLNDANELTQYKDLTFKGRLVNVITNPPALDISKGQTLTLTSLSNPASKDTYYAPLSEINSVRF